jgi:hypothetical protein
MSAPHRYLLVVACIAIGIGSVSCGTPSKLSYAELGSSGVRDGAAYWDAEQGLAQRGYSCYVSGAKRENFDCTRSPGTWPTCVLRVSFVVDDENLVSRLAVSDPACVGTP